MPTESFSCNGTSEPQVFSVPDDVYLLHFLARGASGRAGRGGQVSASLAVVPGNEIQVIVGCQGGYPQGFFGGGIGGHGYGKGGNGGNGSNGGHGGTGGGGGTAVIYEENGLQKKLIAGGGGGSARRSGRGDGGYPSGSNGNYPQNEGGEGGQASRPGAGGSATIDGDPGLGPNGGNGASFLDPPNMTFGGGGGGGGYYGGGGGGSKPGWAYTGGGGSSYYDDVFFNFQYQNGVSQGNGSVVITYDFVDEQDVDVSGLLSAYTVQLGSSVFNSVAVSGLSPEQLQDTVVTFQVFTPDNTSCQGDPFYQEVQDMMGLSQVESSLFQTQHVGTYRWKVILSYGGLIKETICGDPSQNLAVTCPTETVSIVPSGNSVPLKQSVTSTVVFEGLSPLLNPEVTFQVFNVGCQGNALFTYGPVPVVANQVTSGPFVASLPGTYQWIVKVKYTDYYSTSTDCENTSLRFTIVEPVLPDDSDSESEQGEEEELEEELEEEIDGTWFGPCLCLLDCWT